MFAPERAQAFAFQGPTEPAVITRINVFGTGLAIRPGTTSCPRINAFEYKCPELVAQAMMDAWCLDMRALSSRMRGTDANTCRPTRKGQQERQ